MQPQVRAARRNAVREHASRGSASSISCLAQKPSCLTSTGSQSSTWCRATAHGRGPRASRPSAGLAAASGFLTTRPVPRLQHAKMARAGWREKRPARSHGERKRWTGVTNFLAVFLGAMVAGSVVVMVRRALSERLQRLRQLDVQQVRHGQLAQSEGLLQLQSQPIRQGSGALRGRSRGQTSELRNSSASPRGRPRGQGALRRGAQEGDGAGEKGTAPPRC